MRSQVEHTQGVYEAAAKTVDDVITTLTPFCTGDVRVANSAEISSVCICLTGEGYGSYDRAKLSAFECSSVISNTASG